MFCTQSWLWWLVNHVCTKHFFLFQRKLDEYLLKLARINASDGQSFFNILNLNLNTTDMARKTFIFVLPKLQKFVFQTDKCQQITLHNIAFTLHGVSCTWNNNNNRWNLLQRSSNFLSTQKEELFVINIISNR